MSSKDWIDRAVSKPTTTSHDDTPAGYRAGLVELLLNTKKEKMRKEKG